MEQLIECVPNFSEGRDRTIIDAIAREIQSVRFISLLDIDSGISANRTVMTFIGPPDAVIRAAFKAIKKAAELIDMQRQTGVHSRIGATDVCPFVPIANIAVNETIALVDSLAKQVGTELDIPIYLYEHSAMFVARKNLATIRKGGYEKFAEKMKQPEWMPDYGGPGFNRTTGATVMGVRDILIAFNINLDTRSVAIAQEIAATIRESGRLVRNEQGNITHISGLLPACKAVGWYINEYGQAQVSMNLVDFRHTPPHVAFEVVRTEAMKHNVRVTGSELVGLIPYYALLMAGKHYASANDIKNLNIDQLLELAVQSLKLDDKHPFILNNKILEYRCKHFGVNIKYI
ncbi:glutamate formimidoyltransferase [candidate division KSB1 bacterium]|nr:glutamate formimidoyltransferase [candidate division KSB1 bacterium]